MENSLKNILVGIATSLSVASMGVGVNTYVDVQILKNNQSEQKDTVKTIQEILTRIDKTQAVQSETIKTLSELAQRISETKVEKSDR